MNFLNKQTKSFNSEKKENGKIYKITFENNLANLQEILHFSVDDWPKLNFY